MPQSVKADGKNGRRLESGEAEIYGIFWTVLKFDLGDGEGASVLLTLTPPHYYVTREQITSNISVSGPWAGSDLGRSCRYPECDHPCRG